MHPHRSVNGQLHTTIGSSTVLTVGFSFLKGDPVSTTLSPDPDQNIIHQIRLMYTLVNKKLIIRIRNENHNTLVD